MKIKLSLFLFAVSGVLKSKESAQESVSFGVGVYAGSTVFNLTVVWGMCVIFGRKELYAKSVATDHISVLSQLKGLIFLNRFELKIGTRFG